MHNTTDGSDHVYELAGVMNVTCVASRTSVKKAARTNAYPAVVGEDNESSDVDLDDDDDDVYDMSGVAGRTIRAREVDSARISAVYPGVPDGMASLADDDEDVYNVGAAGDTYDTRTTSDTDPTYEILGAIDAQDESQS